MVAPWIPEDPDCLCVAGLLTCSFQLVVVVGPGVVDYLEHC